jgi:methionyl-tRNA formyltransferase
MKQKIVFFGSGWFVIPVIEKLIDRGLLLVVTNEQSGKVVDYCKEKNIDFVSSDLKDSEVVEKITSLNPTVAILASYGAFIPNSVINAFPHGIINIHPSLLPKWKGPSPVQYSLLNGDETTGVTLIRLDDQIDHGPILAQKQYALSGNETSEDLLSILFEIGAGLVVEQIERLEKGEILNEIPQDHSQESWSHHITKEDGKIDLSTIPSSELEIRNWKLEIARRIRALYPWPGVWLKVHVIASEAKQSKLSGKIIKLLPEGKIQVEGKNPMSYKDFINGFGEEGENLLKQLSLI